MSSNEIDDIFSTIHKTKTRDENSSKSTSGAVAKATTFESHSKASKKAEKRRKKKSEKQAVLEAEWDAPQVALEGSEGKGKEACTAVGVSLPAVVVKVVEAVEGNRVSSNHISKRMLDEDDDGFFDSRGDGGKRKKTDDGYDIYHEDELRIGLGGDTADCPFDCTCCF